MTELLPCPFCDNALILPQVDLNAVTVFLECAKCKARGPFISALGDDPREAKARVLAAEDQWNMRGGEWKGAR